MWISRDFPLYPEPTDDSLSCEQQLQPNIVDSPAWVGANPLDSFIEEGTAPWAGEYEKDFDTLKQIGKGAFGYVNLAQRKKDCLVVRCLTFSALSTGSDFKRLWSNLYAREVFCKTVGSRIKSLVVYH